MTRAGLPGAVGSKVSSTRVAWNIDADVVEEVDCAGGDALGVAQDAGGREEVVDVALLLAPGYLGPVGGDCDEDQDRDREEHDRCGDGHHEDDHGEHGVAERDEGHERGGRGEALGHDREVGLGQVHRR